MISEIFVAMSNLACVAGARRKKERRIRARREKRVRGTRVGGGGGGGVLHSEITGFPKLHSHGPPTCTAYQHDNSFSDDL